MDNKGGKSIPKRCIFEEHGGWTKSLPCHTRDLGRDSSLYPNHVVVMCVIPSVEAVWTYITGYSGRGWAIFPYHARVTHVDWAQHARCKFFFINMRISIHFESYFSFLEDKTLRTLAKTLSLAFSYSILSNFMCVPLNLRNIMQAKPGKWTNLVGHGAKGEASVS